MRNNSFKKAVSFLQTTHHTNLQSVFAKIKELASLNKQLLPYFSPSLKKYCRVANLVDGQLVILVANGSVATELRFSTPDLLKKIQQNPVLRKIKTIRYKIQPMQHYPMPRQYDTGKLPLLSPQTGQIIRELAESLQDERLKEIMKRIAQRVDVK